MVDEKDTARKLRDLVFEAGCLIDHENDRTFDRAKATKLLADMREAVTPLIN